MSYLLGLDLGSNSIGWACIDPAEEKVIAVGSRVFQEGVNRDKGKEVSKNETRRIARQSRRQYFRRADRKQKLKAILQQAGMFPTAPPEVSEFLNNQKIYDPYALRKKGLDEKLSKLEFGRALYHLNQRRGFKSSRKSGDSKEDGVVAQATTQLQDKIDSSGCRTLGEYFSGLDPMSTPIRGHYTLRKMYEQEFDLLWEKQATFHPELNDTLKEEVKDQTIFYQRPLKSVAHLIGKCSLEPQKRRCAKHAFEAQSYRILEQVNRLEFIDDDGVVYKFSRAIDENFTENIQELRDKLIEALQNKKEIKFEGKKGIKALLGFSPTTTCNLEKTDKKLIGDRTSHQLRSFFKKKWDSFSQEEREKIHQVIAQAQDPEWLEAYAVKNWELAGEVAAKLGKANLEPGYFNYSSKAIKKLIPFLQEGFSLADAKEKAGYVENPETRSIEERLQNLRNPIVSHALYELLRLHRIIVKEFGEPEKIQIELARELKLPASRRREIHFKNQELREINDNAREEILKMGHRPTGDALLRYKLWDECGQTCPYTGRKISQSKLFNDNEFQIEHIIPYSRSLDDSYMNKTLCCTKENAKKLNQTPYEFYNGNPEYDKVIKRIKNLPYAKQKKFKQKEIDDDFVARQLNDTSYISREARGLFQQMGYTVLVAKGTATSELRYLWGLNTVLRDTNQNMKNREDHRHHAIDAAVVAMTATAPLRKLSQYNKYRREATRKAFPQPWDSFRSDVELAVGNVLVSHQVHKRARGKLHEESIFSALSKNDDKGIPMFAIRKSLTKLDSFSQIRQIADPAVKNIIVRHLNNQGVDVENGTGRLPSNCFRDAELFLDSSAGKRIPIKKVRLHRPSKHMILLPKHNNKAGVEPGSNHHIILYRCQDSNGNWRQKGKVCTLFEATRRVKAGLPLIDKKLEGGQEFICSLAINEMVLFGAAEVDIDWEIPDHKLLTPNLYRVQKISDSITLRHHLVSVLKNEEGEEVGRVIKTPGSFDGIKCYVDRLGNICRAND
ncbi:MAG TPA: type II CRISPR RNA-guided endonuclease Cas9 [Nitrospina sp.]|nr:type II CRISPR RNA-guided endonuclease Cas9 [Nitrospina sp.]